MLEYLKNKWKVNTLNLILIIFTFAIGGSLCGYLARTTLCFFDIHKTHGIIYWVMYIIAMTLLWPICVAAVSIPMGQWIFFRSYIKKIFIRIFGKRN